MPLGDSIAAAATAEWARYGGIKETREPLKSRIRAYYRAVKARYDGGDTDIAWSAAFVSKMVEQVGAGDNFPYNILHAKYVRQTILNGQRRMGVFQGFDAAGMTLRLGDIVASNRQGSKIITFKWASTHGSYFSHSDIVTDIFSETEVLATGGNVGDTVARTTFRNVGGIWMNARNSKHQVFCVIRAVGWLGD